MARTRRNRKTRKLKRGGAANTFEGITFPQTLSIRFHGVQPLPGQLVQQQKTIAEPTVEWAEPQGEFRTLICVDPDAPARIWCHWLIVNADGIYPSTGETFLAWAPPTPPSGVHRYYFCLFGHTAKVLDEDRKEERGYFQLNQFLDKYRMRPIAANMIKVAKK